jgi:hypothetical protein
MRTPLSKADLDDVFVETRSDLLDRDSTVRDDASPPMLHTTTDRVGKIGSASTTDNKKTEEEHLCYYS